MTASAATGTCASESVDTNLAAFHFLIRAEQEDELCRWFRQERYPSIAEAWLACVEPEWMLGLLEKHDRSEMATRKAALRFLRATPTGNGAAALRSSGRILSRSDRRRRPLRRGPGDCGRAPKFAQQVVADADDRMRRRTLRRVSAKRLVLQASYCALGGRDLFDASAVSDLTVRAAVSTKMPKDAAKRFQADLLRSLFGNPFAD